VGAETWTTPRGRPVLDGSSYHEYVGRDRDEPRPVDLVLSVCRGASNTATSPVTSTARLPTELRGAEPTADVPRSRRDPVAG
jgi:hypothetical protein